MMWKRVLTCVLAMMLTIGSAMAGGTAAAEEAQTILSQAAALEAESGKLRSIVVHVYNGDEMGVPTEADAPEDAFLKHLSMALESRWTLMEGEMEDVTPRQLLDLYGQYTAAETEILSAYNEVQLEDPLRNYLMHAYLKRLDRQARAASEPTEDPVAALWQWNDARQEGIKILFFLNRYYGVSVHQTFKSQMSSFLYEGALLVSETTIEELVASDAAEEDAETEGAAEQAEEAETEGAAEQAEDAESAAPEETAEAPEDAETAAPEGEEAEPAPAAEEADAAETAEDADGMEDAEEIAQASETADSALYITEPFGEEVWHTDPTGTYEFRLYGFDSETLDIHAELREKETGRDIPCGAINLSVWEKYKKDRQVLDTFYKASDIENAEGKLSFNLYVNVRFDGRLYRELKGKISLKLPTAAGSSAGEDVGMEEASNDPGFPEAPIQQDFSDVKVGDLIYMGYYEQDGNAENLREPIEWKVISINKRKNIGIVVAVMGLEAVPYGTAGNEDQELEAGFNWKTSWLREWLNGEFYTNNFTAEEKTRIREVSNVTKDPSGRFTTKDYVFLLSAEEAKRYLHTTEGMICVPTAHALEGLTAEGAIVENGYCKWWLRELTSAVKVNRDGTLKKNTKNEAGYVSGSTGMRYYSRKIGEKVYEDHAVVVRPAMWVKFGE